jgi:hypothetical protein
MNSTHHIRFSVMAAALSLIALTSTASAGSLPKPLGGGEQPLSAGVHVLDLVSREQGRPGYRYLPKISVKLPSGWFNYNGWGLNDGSTLSMSFWDVDKVYPTGCQWQGKPKIDPGRTVKGLAHVLATRPLRNASTPSAARLAGFRGEYLRWSVPRRIDFAHCGKGYFESWTGRGWATDRWQQAPGQVDRLWILNINGKRLVIDANYLPSATRKQRTELDRLVHSIKFHSASPARSTAAAAAGQSKSQWRRNTWNETRSGVVHAYFRVPRNHSTYTQMAQLKLRTPATELHLNCHLRLNAIRRRAYSYQAAARHTYVVRFATPSPLRRPTRATAVCRTTAPIDGAWISLGAAFEPIGRFSGIKLRRVYR